MLYDKRWDAKVKAEPLTLEALVVWLKRQPSEQRYCYGDNGRCLAAQYNRFIGRKYITPILWDEEYPVSGTFDQKLEWIAVNGQHTFGEALARALSRQETGAGL